VDRIVFYLNADRGIAAFKAVCGAGHEVAAVVYPGVSAREEEIAALAKDLGAKPLPTADVNAPASLEKLAAIRPRLGIIGGYSTIFKMPLIELPEIGTINLHGGRVPQYRGGSPLNWQIIQGENEIGVSVLRVDERIDSGPVLAVGTFTLGADEDIADAHVKANALFPKILVKTVDDLDAGTLDELKQDEALAGYWHQRNDADGRIDWRAMTAVQVVNLVRGVSRPYPGAFTYLDGQKVRIFKVRVADEVIYGVPGRVLHVLGGGPQVVCADRAVVLNDFAADDGTRLQVKGGQRFD
jgi:methionyl-tRNA formyltransferase